MKLQDRNGFTLLEIGLIIAIVGILMSLGTTCVNSIINSSYRAKSINYMRQIALSIRQYMMEKNHPIRWTDLDEIRGKSEYSTVIVAALLDKYNLLKDANVWSWERDPLVKFSSVDVPTTVIDINGNIDTAYLSGVLPMSVNVIIAGNDLTNDDFLYNGDKIPVCYSRGLMQNGDNCGKWDSESDDQRGVFGETGGLVAYFDGHVEWSKSVECIKYCTVEKTSKLYESLPNGALNQSSNKSSSVNWCGISNL